MPALAESLVPSSYVTGQWWAPFNSIAFQHISSGTDYIGRPIDTALGGPARVGDIARRADQHPDHLGDKAVLGAVE